MLLVVFSSLSNRRGRRGGKGERSKERNKETRRVNDNEEKKGKASFSMILHFFFTHTDHQTLQSRTFCFFSSLGQEVARFPH